MLERPTALSAVARTLGAAALMFLPLGCGPSLNYVYMAKDASGSQKATKFLSVGDQIHCVMEIVGGDEETVIQLDLGGPGGIQLSDDDYYPRPTGEQGPIKVDIQLFQIDDNGNQALTGPWPVGKYSIDVSVDDELEETLDFEVVN